MTEVQILLSDTVQTVIIVAYAVISFAVWIQAILKGRASSTPEEYINRNSKKRDLKNH